MKKTNIALNLTETHEKTLASILKKNVNSLTQNDVIELRRVVEQSLSFDNEKLEDALYNDAFRALRILTNYEMLRPMDQRSFIEFTRDEIVSWLECNDDAVVNEDVSDSIFSVYFADGTMTYNTQESLNYIRAFWQDFHEDDIECFESTKIFSSPEAFLVDQTFGMSRRIISLLLENESKEEVSAEEFLIILEKYSLEELSGLIY